MPTKAKPVRIKVTRRVEVAPGLTGYELTVSKGSSQAKKPKIDAAFAASFLNRLNRESSRIAAVARKPA